MIYTKSLNIHIFKGFDIYAVLQEIKCYVIKEDVGLFDVFWRKVVLKCSSMKFMLV